MPWTTPETFTAGQTLTAASMNAISGNLDAVGGAWSDWSPTWTNFTVGNGTVAGKYIKAGRLVVFSLVLTFGSTSSVAGTIGLTPPAAARATLTGNFTIHLDDAGTALYVGYARLNDVNRIDIGSLNAAGTYLRDGATSATVPFTWGTGDRIILNGEYEAAA
jgi:hypothetical protein